MKTRTIWSGWQVQHMDEIVRAAPVKLKKNTRSVSLPNLTADLATSLLPSLAQVEWLQLNETVEPDAVPILASLPKLTGIDLPAFRNYSTSPERCEQLVKAVCALPNLRSLFALRMPGRLLPLVAEARSLRWLALWHPDDLTTESIAPVGNLQALEELQILGHGVRPGIPVLGAEAFEALASRGCLRDIHLQDLNLAQEAIDAVLSAKGLQKVTMTFPYAKDHKLDVRLADRSDLTILQLRSPGGTGEFRRMPSLANLDLYGFDELLLEELPKVASLELYSAGRVSLRNMPSLRKVRVAIGPDRMEVSAVPKLASVSMPLSSMDASSKESLRAALPRAELQFERPTYKKRKRTAPKRTLAPKAWKHPRVGIEEMSYALLVIGRTYEQDLAVAKGKELATIAEAWSAQLKEHVIAVMPFDLSKTGSLSSSDEVSPVVIGRVVTLVSADDGPSAAVDVEKVRKLMAQPLPQELWAEMAGVVGNDALEQARDGLYLVASGPLSEALLAFGKIVAVDRADTASLVRGQKFDQTAHPRGVEGVLVEATEEAAELDLDDLPKDGGTLHVICRYD